VSKTSMKIIKLCLINHLDVSNHNIKLFSDLTLCNPLFGVGSYVTHWDTVPPKNMGHM